MSFALELRPRDPLQVAHYQGSVGSMLDTARKYGFDLATLVEGRDHFLLDLHVRSASDAELRALVELARQRGLRSSLVFPNDTPEPRSTS